MGQQHGFMPMHEILYNSTAIASYILVMDDWTNALEHGYSIDVI